MIKSPGPAECAAQPTVVERDMESLALQLPDEGVDTLNRHGSEIRWAMRRTYR